MVLSLPGKVFSGYYVSNIENKVISIPGLNEAAAIASSTGNSDSREGSGVLGYMSKHLGSGAYHLTTKRRHW